MAIRMQQRRGTAEQWTLADPVLAAGEIGWESDTNQLKMGDGVRPWSELAYFVDEDSIDGSLEDYIPISQKGATGGVAELDENGKVPSSQLAIDELAQDAIDGALTAGTGITKTYNDEANTITVAADTTVIAPLASPTFTGTVVLPSATSIGDVSSTELGYLNNVTSAIQTQLDGKAASSHTHAQSDITNLTTDLAAKAPLANPTFTGTVVLPSTTSIGDVSSTELGYPNNVTSAIQTQLDGKAASSHSHSISDVTNLQTSLDAKLNLSGGTMTGKITLDADPTQALHATTKQYVDNVSSGILAKPQVIAATTANLDATYSNGTNGVGATLTANSNGAFPQIDGVSVTTVNGQRGVLVKNQTNAAHNGRYNLTTQGDSENPWVLTRCGLCDEASEIPGAYVFVTDGTANGQTGWVQHVDNPATFIVGTDDIDVFQFAGAGTVTAGTGIDVAGNQVSVDFDDVAAKVHTHLLADITDVTASVTEINYVDGVTSAIQTQLDGKAASSHTHPQSDITNLTTDLAAKAPLASPTFTGTVVLPSDTSIGDVSSTELSYLNNVTSAIQTQLDGKSPAAGSTSITTVGTVTTATSPTAAGSKGLRNITISTAEPSAGADGDVWLVYQ